MKKALFGLLLVAHSFSQANNLEESEAKVVDEKVTPKEKGINEAELFEKAVELIKKYETIHGPECLPYTAYGHMLTEEDSLLTLPVTEAQADSILRVDLNKKMSYFKGDYKVRLLLGMLSYNVGQYRIINTKGEAISGIGRALLESNSIDIDKARTEYIEWRCWNGKVIKSIEKRRIEEFEIIFPKH